MDALDRLIADAARDYHSPPPTVPRDAMWQAIAAARAAVPPSAVRSLADARAERDARRRGLLAVAAAAAIFLATGVGIGRWWGRGDVASVGSTVTAPSTTALATPAGPASDTATSVASTDRGRAIRVPGGGRVAAARGAGRDTDRPGGAGADPYDVAVLRHFAQAEALLVSYRADTVDAAMDRRLAAWARPLLSDTRLLLDSPAASDPRRRQLLEDLELVLAQVARLAPASTRDSAGQTVAGRDSTARDRGERALIDGSIRRAQLMPRLRTVVPAGT